MNDEPDESKEPHETDASAVPAGPPRGDRRDDIDEPPVPQRPRGGLRNSFGAFSNRGFAIFWLGAIVSNTGGWLSNLAVPYVIYQTTGSALWVGLAAVAQFAPGVILGPLGGSLADRFNRRMMLLITQSGLAVAAFSLWLLWISGVHEPIALLIPIMFQGVFQGVNGPAWQSFVNDLVPRADLRSAVTLNSLQFNMARSFGPAIAGVLLAAFGPGPAFLLNSISFAFVLGALMIVKPLQPQRRITVTGSIMRQFGRAMRYMGEQPGILVSFIVTMIIGLFSNPLFSLTVVFAEDVFRVDALGLGILNAALGLGAMLIAPVIAGLSNRLPLAKVVVWGMVIYAIAMVALGFVPGDAYWLALMVLVVIGGALLAVNSSVVAALQFIVADDMRGRVMAVRMVFFTATFPIGTMIQTAITDWLNVNAAVMFGGICTLLALAVLLMTPGRARMTRLDDPHDESGSFAS